jgi:endonuclease-3 related protein
MVLSPSRLYEVLLLHFGNRHWWPVDIEYHKKNNSDPRFEIMVGAILTQNTAWTNVERALNNLKENSCFTISKMVNVDIEKLKTMIQPSGFFNQKANRLKTLSSYLYNNYGGDLDKFFNRDLHKIREELLSIKGIGPETADSILLYAGNLPVFVIDAYTKRICIRLPLRTESDSYNNLQQFFENELPKKNNVQLYKDMHALIVELAKCYCKKKPNCKNCPLKNECEYNLSQQSL